VSWALERVTAAKTDLVSEDAGAYVISSKRSAATTKTVTQYLDGSPQSLKDLFADLEAFIVALGDEVTKKTLKLYFAYRRLKNFACVEEVHPQTQTLLVYLKVDPDSLQLEEGFSRDVRSIGHFGTGDLEVRIKNAADLAKAQPLIQQSYSTG